jgi:hypothetical protein
MIEPALGRRAILQIVPSLEAGGAERTTIDIARALTHAGQQALVASEGGRLTDELTKAGGEWIALPVAAKNPLTLLANAARLTAIIRERKGFAGACAIPRVRLERTHGGTADTHSLRYHLSRPVQFKWAAQALVQFFVLHGDRTIANSEWTPRTFATPMARA